MGHRAQRLPAMTVRPSGVHMAGLNQYTHACALARPRNSCLHCQMIAELKHPTRAPTRLVSPASRIMA